MNSGADALVRGRPPGRPAGFWKGLILREKSGTRASRADQGVRPTITARIPCFEKACGIRLQPAADLSPPAAGLTPFAGGRAEAQCRVRFPNMGFCICCGTDPLGGALWATPLVQILEFSRVSGRGGIT